MNRFLPLCLALLLLLPSTSHAGGSRIWELAGFEELQKGELNGTVLSSAGDVRIGLTAEKAELPEEGVGAVWSAARNRKGERFVGTGYDGRIYRIKNRKAVLKAETGQLVITAMVFDKNGALYAASLPDPIIWRVSAADLKKGGDKPAAAKKWATLPEGTEHVWSLVFSPDGRTLYAGTGPEGKIFAVDKNGKPELFLDSEEEHILSMTTDSEGRLLAGTSPSAVLFRVTAPGRALAVADFDSVEVKAVVTQGDDIYVAVNNFKSPPLIPSKSKSSKPRGRKRTGSRRAAAARTSA